MAPFVFPKALIDLEDDPADADRLFVRNPVDISVLSPPELEEIVKGVSFDLSDKEIVFVEEQELFDQIYSLAKGFAILHPSLKTTLVESLRSNFSVLIANATSICRSPSQDEAADRIPSCLNAFKIYTYFLLTIVLSEESSAESLPSQAPVNQKGRRKHVMHSWNWELQRGKILSLVANSLETDLKSLFGASELDDNYLSFVVRSAFTLSENMSALKEADTKDALARIIGTCATKYHYTTQASATILHLILKFEFLPSYMAEVIAWSENKYMDGSLALSLIREIGRMNPKDFARDTVGADNISRFLVELTDRLPKLVVTNVGMLVPHFGGESYKIRNGLIGVLGKLVVKAFKDLDGDPAALALRSRGKQAMLDILLERCRDVSAYTRSRVLQVWSELCEEHAVSMGLWNKVVEIAVGRLEDKSAIVRKSALNLLITMLQYNPFGPQLRTTSFEATLEKYQKKLLELSPASSSVTTETNEVPESNSQEAQSGTVYVVGLEEQFGAVANESQSDSLPDSCVPSVESDIPNDVIPEIGNLEQIRALVASLEAGLRFTKRLSSTMPTLVQLLASPTSTDVEYTILFLMRCRQFQIEGAEDLLLKMLPLVFSQDKSIHESVMGAFKTIYITKSAVETSKKLSSLATDSSIGDLAALEYIISSLVAKGDISTSTISALWDIFCFNVSGVTARESCGALSTLCMASKSSAKILSSHLQEIIDIGFGRWAKEEPLLARTACVALHRLSDEEKEKLISNGARVFEALQNVIHGSWLPDSIWYSAAEKAVSAIYALHPRPENLAAKVVRKAYNSVFESGTSENDSNAENLNEKSCKCVSAVSVRRLSRFFFIVSHVALNQLVYIETCVKKIQKQKKAEKAGSGSQIDGDASACITSNKENGINSDLGLSALDDVRLDSIAERTEKEIVCGVSVDKNLIGLCAPLVSKLCRNFNLMQQFPELQDSSMLALCKLMIIDSDFCEANLQLLFTVVGSSPLETVRSNCTIALGDLAVRFPNLLEPWTELMYARLGDPAISVRKNAVLVLSHLVLNDMMKVKGSIHEMALRLEDEDERISSLAKLFFHEWSKKGSNPIYNLLPDILSRLSCQNLKGDTFCNIMQFLIGSIKKDKQMEGLVEKLCNRFHGVSDVKQWEGIAYCLAQLTYTEKAFKKLIELLKSYEHTLLHDSVICHFRSIISKAKRFSKPEIKIHIEEFEGRLNKIHEESKEQEVCANNAMKHQQKTFNVGKSNAFVEATGENFDATSADDVGGEVVNPSGEDCFIDDQCSNAGDEDNSKSSSCMVTPKEREKPEVQSSLRSGIGASKIKRTTGARPNEREKDGGTMGRRKNNRK